MSNAAAATASKEDSNPAKVSLVRVIRDPERDPDKRPLDMKLIRRLFGYMKPYTAKRNWLLFCVLLRAAQLPAVAWAIGAVINGPITAHANWFEIFTAAMWVLALGLFTQVTFHFR